MPTNQHPNIATFSLNPFVNAFKHCQAASPCLAAWLEYWQRKTSAVPEQKLSYHLNPEDSRLFGTLKRIVKSIVRTGQLPFDGNSAETLLSELQAMIGKLRAVFCKKSLSRYSDDDVAVLSTVEESRKQIVTALAANQTTNLYVDNISDSIRNFIEIAYALNTVITRRENMVGGREPDEVFPRVELGRYAKAFIRFADQNVGLVAYKDETIGAFYVNRAARSAWNYLRPMLETANNDGWVVIEGNVRQGFGRTTANNDVDQNAGVVRLGRYVHCRQRGHTSKHEWRISTELYQQTSHTD